VRFSNPQSETLLQIPHRMAERGWRDTEPRRRGAKAQVIGNSDECCQIGQIATVHFNGSAPTTTCRSGSWPLDEAREGFPRLGKACSAS
jgi:hypothetical protein